MERIVQISIIYTFCCLIKFIDNRTKRMTLERILGIIAFIEDKTLYYNCSFSDIKRHRLAFRYTFNKMLRDTIPHTAPIIKVWSGR